MKNTALAALAFALFASPGSAHPVLSFDERSIVQPVSPSHVKASDRTSPVRVTLGHRYLSLDSAAGRDILDFKIHRVYHVDLRKKTYEQSSLFAMVAFALLEAQNRVAANAGPGAAEATNDWQMPPMVAQLFSVQAGSGDEAIDTVKSGDDTVYRWNGHDLLAISAVSKPLPPEYQAEYWRWVRLYYGGHPKVLAQLKDYAGVPESLRILRPDVNANTTETLRLKSIADTDANSYSLENLTLTAPKAEPYLTLRRLSPDSPAALETQAATTLKDRDTAAAAGRAFDAELAFLVLSVSTGETDSEWARKMGAALRADKDASALTSALAARTGEQLKIAAAALAALRNKSSSRYAYILDVFAANHELKLKNAPAAERLFVAALGHDPYLTGAWFDLGKMYYATFRTREAWACWDAARALNRTHPFRKDIDTVELHLTEQLPDFF